MPTAPHILDVDLPEEKPAGEPAVRGGAYQHIETNPNMFGGAICQRRTETWGRSNEGG